MQKEISQKQFYINREAKIQESNVFYKSKIFGNEAEVSIPYEELSREKYTYIKTIPYVNIVIGILSLFTFISLIDEKEESNAWFFWAVLLLASVTVYFFTREVLWKVRVQNNTYLFFLKNYPDKESVNQFIENLFKARDQYLRETYFFEPTKNITYESQRNTLQWLRRVEAINGEEFNVRKKELDEMFNLEAKKIGFN